MGEKRRRIAAGITEGFRKTTSSTNDKQERMLFHSKLLGAALSGECVQCRKKDQLLVEQQMLCPVCFYEYAKARVAAMEAAKAQKTAMLIDGAVGSETQQIMAPTSSTDVFTLPDGVQITDTKEVVDIPVENVVPSNV